MKRSFKTSFFGILTGLFLFLGQQGVKVGHIGNSDFIALGAAISAAVTGLVAKDHDVPGGEVKQ